MKRSKQEKQTKIILKEKKKKQLAQATAGFWLLAICAVRTDKNSSASLAMACPCRPPAISLALI
jgi:hypothetical protein